MAAKPTSRKWSDVQTAIATAAIVGTLGLWNLFATPSKAETVQASEPVVPPPTEPPAEEAAPIAMPQVKIIFTQTAPQTTAVQPVQQPTKKKKNRNNNNNDAGPSNSITQTKTS